MLDVAFPIVHGEGPLYGQTFDRLEACIYLSDHTLGLGRIFVVIEPLTTVGVGVADILLFGILNAAVEACGWVVESHARHSIERSVTEYHVTSGGCILG